MVTADTILAFMEQRIDLGMGRRRFCDWAREQLATFDAAQVFSFTANMRRKALHADNPAAWVMWAIKRPLPEWMTDREYDQIKRLRHGPKRSSAPEPIERLASTVRLPAPLGAQHSLQRR